MGIKVSDLAPHLAAKLGLETTGPGKPGTNKYNAKATTCGRGHRHASKAESRRCDELHLLASTGSVRGLEQQPVYFFTLPDGRQVRDRRGRAVRYTADFRYEEQRGPDQWVTVVEDVKSRATMTEAATLRMAFFRAFHPEIELREVS